MNRTEEYENGFEDGIEVTEKKYMMKRSKAKKLLKSIQGMDFEDAIDYLVKHYPNL